MKSLIHPYIIRLYEVSEEERISNDDVISCLKVMESKNLIYLVTEYAANGELLGELIDSISSKFYFFWLDFLRHEKRLSEAKAKEKFRQLVFAVEYIHSKNIVRIFSYFF